MIATVSCSTNPIAFDITQIVKQWKSEPNYGVMIRATNEATIVGHSPRFVTDEGCGSQCPYLEVVCNQPQL